MIWLSRRFRKGTRWDTQNFMSLKMLPPSVLCTPSYVMSADMMGRKPAALAVHMQN